MKKRMIIMLIILAILFGGIVAYKMFIKIMTKKYFAKMQQQTITVSTWKVSASAWSPTLQAVGSTRAITGVNVTTDLAGMVQTIYFTPGATVTKGTPLVQLNAGTQIGQLQADEATVKLDEITYNRDKKQLAVGGVSKQQVDTDYQNWQNAIGQAASQKSTVEKLTIRAPFTGRLGISQVNPGQYLNAGDTVTTLQTLNPIYVDFYLPQQTLGQIKLQQAVSVATDAFAKHLFAGKITTINPIVDTETRNVEVEATVSNPDYLLIPGMFTNVTVNTGVQQSYLTVPQTAITYNPFGDLVYIVTEHGKNSDGSPILIANQSFVTTGMTRGDQIAVLTGLKAGETIVSSGQLKLSNGSHITVNNKVQPPDNPHPIVTNQHKSLSQSG